MKNSETGPQKHSPAKADVSTRQKGSPELAAILPGIKPVLEFLQSSPEQVDSVFIRKGRKDSGTDKIIDLCRQCGVRFNLASEQTIARLYPGNCQGVLARLSASGFTNLDSMLEETPSAPLPLLLALDQVLDPGNSGTLARTLYALGGAGIIIPKHHGAYLGPAASRSSAGSLSKLPVAKVTNLSQALDKATAAGFTIYAATVAATADSIYYLEPQFPAVLVLGGEENGIRPSIAKRCTHMLQIPMLRDFNSLNVAQAGAIMLGFFSCRLQFSDDATNKQFCSTAIK